MVITRVLDRVRERGDGAKFEFLLEVIAGHVEHCTASELFLIHLHGSQHVVRRILERPDSPPGSRASYSYEHTSSRDDSPGR